MESKNIIPENSLDEKFVLRFLERLEKGEIIRMIYDSEFLDLLQVVMQSNYSYMSSIRILIDGVKIKIIPIMLRRL